MVFIWFFLINYNNRLLISKAKNNVFNGILSKNQPQNHFFFHDGFIQWSFGVNPVIVQWPQNLIQTIAIFSLME